MEQGLDLPFVRGVFVVPSGFCCFLSLFVVFGCYRHVNLALLHFYHTWTALMYIVIDLRTCSLVGEYFKHLVSQSWFTYFNFSQSWFKHDKIIMVIYYFLKIYYHLFVFASALLCVYEAI